MSQAFGHRRSIRLPTYDYGQSGAYFITICTQDRQPFFGDIKGGVMRLSECGLKVDQVWHDLPSRFPWIALDAFQIMPDHIHAIVWIHRPVDGKAPIHSIRRGESHSPFPKSHSPFPKFHSPSHLMINEHREPPPRDTGRNTADAMASAEHDGNDGDSKIGEGGLKNKKGEWDSPLQCGTSKTVGSIVRGLKIPVTQWARQSMGVHDVWQRNYFERIIRSQQGLESIRRYITNNPARWREH